MSERTLVDYVLRGMKGHGHFTKHADAWTPGIADLSWRVRGVNGWLELKNASRVPVRAGTRLKLDSEFTGAQAAFLLERDGKLLTRVQPRGLYVGLSAGDAMALWRAGGWSLADWLAAGIVWQRRIDWEEFTEWLISTRIP